MILLQCADKQTTLTISTLELRDQVEERRGETTFAVLKQSNSMHI